MKKITITTLLFFFISPSIFLIAQNFQINENSNYGKYYPKTGKYLETPNYYLFQKNSLKAENKKDKISEIANDLKTEADEDKIKTLMAENSKIQKELQYLEFRKDSLWNEYVKDYIEYKSSIFPFGNDRSQALFDLIYKDDTNKRFSLLNNSGLNIGKNTGSVYTELVSGQLFFLRASLGVMVAANSNSDSTESKEEEAFQRLSTYGGNTVLTLEYPLYYYHLRNNRFIFLSRIISKASADLPEFGTTSKDWAGSVAFGIDIYTDVATSNNAIRFFANINWSQYYGTDVFQENLGLDNSNFDFGQIKLGIVWNNVSISFIVRSFSSQKVLENRNVIGGGKIIH